VQVGGGHRIDLFEAAAGTSHCVDQERAPTLLHQDRADGSGELTGLVQVIGLLLFRQSARF
jgi:hypothetical protein